MCQTHLAPIGLEYLALPQVYTRVETVYTFSIRYGRMRFGRCMKEDHGSHGCSVDALSHLDHICSGKQTCSLDIPDAALHKMQTCPKEIMSYLEAEYSCIKGKSLALA